MVKYPNEKIDLICEDVMKKLFCDFYSVVDNNDSGSWIDNDKGKG